MNTSSPIAEWDDYALSFQSVMPSHMFKLNREVCSHMVGHVADYGCGAGKIIPLIARNQKVASYTGIDAAVEMVARAQWMSEKFPATKIGLINGKIEENNIYNIDSALSVNSYYTWPDTTSVLLHIFRQLNPNAIFVLASINRSINIAELLEDAETEMIAHPHWQQFKDHNLKICGNDLLKLISLDDLIYEVRQVGFKVLEAHQKHYLGGLNFLVLKK